MKDGDETKFYEDWQKTFDAIEDLIFIQDTNYTIVRTNKAFADALGLEAKDVVGKKCYEVLHRRNSPWPECPFERTQKDGKAHSQEVDDPEIGLPLLVSTSPLFDENGKLAGSVHIAKNIAEHKKAEEIYRVLFNSSRDAIMTLEPPTWAFTAGNPATIKMFECEDEKEFLSYTPGQLSPEKQPNGQPSSVEAKAMIEKAIRDGSNFFDWIHKTAKGKEFHATVLLTRIEIEKGKPFLQATVRDITEQKKAADELKNAKAELEDRVKERTAELEKKLAELEAFRKATVDREFRMEDMHKEIERLKMEKDKG